MRFAMPISAFVIFLIKFYQPVTRRKVSQREFDPENPMTPIHPDADYQKFLREGRFMIQRSRSSGRHVFYPRVVAPGTGTDDLEWVEASGEGTVYSSTVVRARPPAVSYNVALVELAEGPRMTTRIEGIAAEQVKIGMAVRARIVSENDQVFVVFDPAETAAN
jgi:uncharacterized OB-fold protein